MVSDYSWHIRVHRSFEDLENLKDSWNHWAGDHPFRRFEWQRTWWRVYGRARPGGLRSQLCVLTAWRDGTLGGIVPLYRRWHPLWGWIVGWLGSGEVCSDYLGPITSESDEERVAAVAVTALHALNQGQRRIEEVFIEWPEGRRLSCHRIDLDGMRATDKAVSGLRSKAGSLGWALNVEPVANSWAVSLPTSWEAYLSNLPSKKARRRFRKLSETCLQNPNFALHLVGQVPGASETHGEAWQKGWEILVRLHQARRKQLGERGCFDSPHFREFHQSILKEYLPTGRAFLAWLDYQGQPIAAEYFLSGGKTLLNYQSGIDPKFLALSPGYSITIALIRWAIEAGYKTFDFLRGDEGYKQRFGATPTQLVRVRGAPPQLEAKWRFAVWQWGRRSREFFRRRKIVSSEPALGEAKDDE